MKKTGVGEVPLPFGRADAAPEWTTPAWTAPQSITSAPGPAAARKPAPKADAAGHRERLREKLFNAGPEALHDYELLEAALFLAFPRGDTKPLAKALIREFGDLSGVLGASADELKRVRGIGDTAAAAIKVIQAISVRALRREAMGGPVMTNIETVLDYLHLDKAGLIHEQFRVLFLNSRNRLLRDEILWEGTVNQAPAYPREIVKRALELGSTAIILVHNHPSGDTTPSQDDLRLTRAIVDAARPLGIGIHDHLIVGRTGHSSFRGKGLL